MKVNTKDRILIHTLKLKKNYTYARIGLKVIFDRYIDTEL